MFDAPSYSTIASAAASISASSAFSAPALQFHVKIFEALEDESRANEITAALKKVSPVTAPLQGRFVRWEVALNELRVLVECDDLSRLNALLKMRGLSIGPSSPQPLHVTIGSLHGIDPQHHSAFLSAVQAAFPITSESRFTCTQLGYGPVHLAKGCKGLQLRELPCDKTRDAAPSEESSRALCAKKAPRQSQPTKATTRRGTKWNRADRGARASTSAMEVDHRPRAVTIRKPRRPPSTHQGPRKAWRR